MSDTAHRQDAAGGLYDFPAREYSIQGRWPSPDPAGVSSTCPRNPQTQNRYAYVRNNPITYTDPTGMDGACEDDPFCGGPCPWWDPFWGDCGGGGGFRGGGGGGGGGEIPRPFPWPLLPPGLFGALSSSGTYFRTVRCSCYGSPFNSIQRYGCDYLCFCAGGDVLIAVRPGFSLIYKECGNWKCPAHATVTHVPGLGIDWGSIIDADPPGFCPIP
jgi:RHS repeat-associated protein